MSSVWGEKCPECQKQKSEIFKLKGDKRFKLKHILLNEHAREINEYLCCNDCSKMIKVLDDPIYKTLNEEQQMIFKFVRLFPFPKSIRELKDEFFRMSYAIRLNGCNLNRLNKNIFSILKDIYEDLYIDWKEERCLKHLLTEIAKEMNKRRKTHKVDNSDALYYIIQIIQDLVKIHKEKSGRRSSEDYTYPSLRKYIRFSVGDKLNLRKIIYNNIIRGFYDNLL